MILGGECLAFGNFNYLCQNYAYEKDFIPIYIYSCNCDVIQLWQ